MKLTLIVTTAIVGTAFALPSASSAAPPPPPPTQDSVVLTDGPGEAGRSGLIVREIEATSGPSGEDPSGQVAFDFMGGPNQGGPVTCLSVSGHTAIIGTLNESVSGIINVIQVVDGQPDTFGVSPTSRAPTDCSPLPPEFFIGGPLSSGDIKVVDAQPLPTTKDQCRNGGWQQFGFKNQGRCVAFVNHPQ